MLQFSGFRGLAIQRRPGLPQLLSTNEVSLLLLLLFFFVIVIVAVIVVVIVVAVVVVVVIVGVIVCGYCYCLRQWPPWSSLSSGPWPVHRINKNLEEKQNKRQMVLEINQQNLQTVSL